MTKKQFIISLAIIIILFVSGMLKVNYESNQWEHMQDAKNYAQDNIPPLNTTNYPNDEENQTQAFFEAIEEWEEYVVTAYCPERCCNGKWAGKTSTGAKMLVGRTIAVDPKVIPYGSLVEIEGLGIYVAEDCGGSIKGNRLDLLFATEPEADKFGVQKLKVRVVQ